MPVILVCRKAHVVNPQWTFALGAPALELVGQSNFSCLLTKPQIPAFYAPLIGLSLGLSDCLCRVITTCAVAAGLRSQLDPALPSPTALLTPVNLIHSLHASPFPEKPQNTSHHNRLSLHIIRSFRRRAKSLSHHRLVGGYRLRLGASRSSNANRVPPNPLPNSSALLDAPIEAAAFC